jgi:hypothetical protein
MPAIRGVEHAPFGRQDAWTPADWEEDEAAQEDDPALWDGAADEDPDLESGSAGA